MIMKCKKCGKENELNSKFCIYCGQKFFDKKIIVIPISIAVVIATIIMVALPSKKETVVDKVDPMKSALEYYNAQEYEKAEEMFLQVVEEDGQIVYAYQYLYEIYDITGQEDKKSEILILAKSNLNEEDYEIIKLISMKTKYNILDRSVPNFENIPIENYDKNGYLIKINGYYGFIDINGNYIVDPHYESGLFQSTGSSQETVCFFPDKTKTGVIEGENLNYYLNKNSQLECGAGFGGAYVGDYFLDDDHCIYFEAPLEDGKRYSDINITLTRTITNPNEKGKYYIVNNNLNLFGPYDESEICSFGIYGSFNNENVGNIGEWNVYSGIYYYVIRGLFYEKIDNQYRIWNADGTKCTEELFDSVEAISENTMRIEKDGYVGVIDENLNLVLFGDFEEVTHPIDNKAYVKIDGKWQCIELT